MWLLFQEVWLIIIFMKVLGIIFLLFIFWPPSVGAQELTPRAYWPAPHGTRLLSVGLSQVNGDTAPDPTLPITEIDSDIQTALLGYLQTISLFGRTANVILEVPYSHGDTMGEGSDRGTEITEFYFVNYACGVVNNIKLFSVLSVPLW